MSLLLESNLFNYLKCGEILTYYVDERLYKLKCIFCMNIYKKFEEFMDHIERNHRIENQLPEENLNVNDEIEITFNELKEECLDIKMCPINFNDAKTHVENAGDPLTKSNLAISKDERANRFTQSMEDILNIKPNHENNAEFENLIDYSDSEESNTEWETMEDKSLNTVDEFDTNEKMTLSLIEALEKLPLLWNKKHPEFKIREKKEAALRKLCRELNKQFKKRMKFTGVQKRVKKLRNFYRLELLNEENGKHKRNTKKPNTYFSKLHFLKDSLQKTTDLKDNENFNNSENSEESETEETALPKNTFLDTEIDTNKDLSLALIEGWKKSPLLWDKKNPQYNIRKKREEALVQLGKELNKRFGKRLKWTGIEERMNKLQNRYRSELLNEQNAISKGENYKPTWYFSKLHFLKDSIKLTQKEIDHAKSNGKSAIPFTKEQHFQFIEMYGSYANLWDIEHENFKSKSHREKSLKEISTLLQQKMSLSLSVDEVYNELRRIRRACTKEKHEQLKCERLGTTYKPTLEYFSNISFLFEHICPFKCPYCKQIFKGREPFRVHKSKHDGSSPYTCSICNKVLSTPGNLTIHLRRHNREYKFECKPCNRKFATTDEYKIHQRQHTGEKPYFCETCGKSFATNSLFGRHKRHHENRPAYFCTICDRGFYEQITYKEHMNVHNNVRDRVCEVCGKGFTHRKYLRQHVLIHSGRKDYICTICDKRFAQSAGLYWHMKTHGTKLSEKNAAGIN